MEEPLRIARAGLDRAWGSGLLLGGLAPAALTLGATCVKLLSSHVPLLEICLVRAAAAAAASLAAGAATGVSPLLGRRRNAALLVVRGVCGTFAVACNYTAVSLLPLGDAVSLAMLKPPVVAACGWLFLGEPLGPVGVAGLGVSLLGVVLVAQPPGLFGERGGGGWSRARAVGTAAALGSCCLVGAVAYAIRRIGQSEAALTVALAFHLCTLSIAAPPVALSWPTAPVTPTLREAGLLLAVSIASFAAQLFVTRSLQLLPAGRASALGFTAVIYGHALGMLVFHERPTLASVGGSLVILAGVAMTSARPKSSGGKEGGGAAEDAGAAKGGDPSHQRQQQQQQQQLAEWEQNRGGPRRKSSDSDQGGRREDEEAPLLPRLSPRRSPRPQRSSDAVPRLSPERMRVSLS